MATSDTVEILLDTSSPEDYLKFLRLKRLPRVRFQGRLALVPREYAASMALSVPAASADYSPSPFLFDYQRDIAALAVRKKRFAVFARCGLGKSLIYLDYAKHVASVLPPGKAVLICCPLMVIKQLVGEAARFYGDSLALEQVSARDLPKWLASGSSRIGITNYESIREGLEPGRLGGLILDESQCLKSHYGAWGQRLIEMGRGLEWKLCATGTPAPNDRIEFANHAVFLDRFPTVNAFLARYFVNRGQTGERWELKPHALRPFYRSLSDWCIFLENPATYGWKDNVGAIPPIHIHIHEVGLTEEQREIVTSLSGDLYGTPGGMVKRSKLAQLAKGRYAGKDVSTLKPAFIRDLIGTWQDRESTLVWCKFNEEQDGLARILPGCESITGATKQADRERIVADFQAGRLRTVVTKPDILGLGLDLQICTRQVFSTCQDSYEDFWQAVARSNRVGSTMPLNVHLPVTPVEEPMMENVLRKVKRVQQDAEEQEATFKEVRFL